jgi:transcriptional regulator with XRE-family HTH domain
VPDPLPDHLLRRRHTIGQHIRAARMDANLTQEALALAAGLDRQAINRIEQGHTSPLLDSLLRIADTLRVPLADLVRYDDPAGGGPVSRRT